MKKTIAKLMAAAMMLSAVPAVTLPSFVSKADTTVAATNTTTATYATQFLGGEGTVRAAADGEIFSFYLPKKDTDQAAGPFKDQVISPSDDFSVVAVAKGLGTEITANIIVSKVIANGSDLVHVKGTFDVAKMTASNKSAFVKAVQENNNTYKVRITRKNINLASLVDTTLQSKKNSKPVYTSGMTGFELASKVVFGEIMIAKGDDEVTIESNKVFTIGGSYDGGKIKTGVQDEDGYLMDGNVYAKLDKVTSDGIAEVQLLKQDNNEVNKLKNNDVLRGKLLKLNNVQIGGVNYKVGKLGAQCLKEAKMKKIQLKNCSKVGKGALRKCKQLRNVNLKDKNKVRKIHAKAFYDCKNLKNISIDARKLNTVGTESFTKVKKNCKIKLKASKSKYNQVVKKIKKANKKNTTLKYSRIAP
jgi:hypothetical protein